MDTENKKEKNSKLDLHLKALGIEETKEGEQASVQAQLDLMEKMQLPPLRLPPEEETNKDKLFSWDILFNFRVYGGFAMMAVITLAMLYLPTNENPYGIKGSSMVKVVYEVDYKISPFKEGVKLPNGAKVRAEVYALEPSVAFLAISNESDQLLTELPSILNSALIVEAGAHKFFEGSFELIGESEGETIRVLQCPATWQNRLEQDTDLLLKYIMSPDKNVPDSSCELNLIKLR